jgi:hypothetical protein
MGLCEADKSGRWVQVAGPPLTSDQLWAGSIPDGPNCRWQGGVLERIETKNRAALKAAEQAEIDGVKCFVARREI